jgi:hypothetical protein
MHRISFAWVIVSLILCATSAGAADPAWRDEAAQVRDARRSYVERVVSRARALGLHRDKTWLRLLHYRKALFGGYASEADGPLFFTSEEGDSDPEAELEGTLRAFYGPRPADPKIQHPYCRFPARFRFLESKLSLDRELLPTTTCQKYLEFVGRLQAKKVILVFSSYYLNNPASAFGHTFLRIGKGQGEERQLLDTGINFSATVDTENAIAYAFKGMVGLFPGEFSKVPYAAKVREYNDFESRDIWEYELDLDQTEVNRVVDHLWELGSTYFWYYYLTENCSYHILGALEVARPELELIEPLGFPVLPVDTVKVLVDNPGLVRNVSYRPSNRTLVRQRLEGLTGSEREAVGKIMRHPRASLSGLSVAEQVRVLDTAIDLADIALASDLLKERKDVDRRRADMQQALLERRAEFLVPSDDFVYPVPFRQAPEVGHDSSRVGLGSGYSRERGYFHALSFRLALHDLADPVAGYPAGSQIEFLPVSLRYLVESPRLRLERLSLVRVRSFTPLTRFDRPWSWTIDVGMTRTQDRGCRDCVAAFGEFGAGFTLGLFDDSLLFFALADARLLGPVRSGYWDVLRLATGPFGGLVLRFGDALTLFGAGSWHYLPFQELESTYSVETKLRLAYRTNFGFGVEAKLEPEAASVEAVSYLYF